MSSTLQRRRHGAGFIRRKSRAGRKPAVRRPLNTESPAIPPAAESEPPSVLGTPIESLDLSVRTYNLLKREGVNTLDDLVGDTAGKTEADLLDIRNFGQKSLDEVKVKLAGQGIALKPDASVTEELAGIAA